ncbi:hypothetical protein KY309_00660 [Candidatus Woesearchaeota archaeon]|nr:hypothetical protein [Candidatus Woesearchaeota archaeon]
MLPAIIALLAFIIFIIIMAVLFLKPLVVVLANTIILYVLFIRTYTEITKYGRAKTYTISAIIALLIVYLAGNFLPLWWITTAALLMFVLARIYIIYKK